MGTKFEMQRCSSTVEPQGKRFNLGVSRRSIGDQVANVVTENVRFNASVHMAQSQATVDDFVSLLIRAHDVLHRCHRWPLPHWLKTPFGDRPLGWYHHCAEAYDTT